MKLVKLSHMFVIGYGNSFSLNQLKQIDNLDSNSVNFVSRTEKNNGVSAIVEKIDNIEPFKKGVITVAGSGNSVLEASLQPFPFYTGYHVFILSPKKSMTDLKKLYYCSCIKKNRYKYSFGRQANKTLSEILIPSIDDIPKWVDEKNFKLIKNIRSTFSANTKNSFLKLNVNKWKIFRYRELFHLSTEPFVSIEESKKHPGKFLFISTSATNNGVTCFTGIEKAKAYPKNCITVASSGNAGQAFFQPSNFKVTNMVIILKPKFEINKFIGIFLTTLIQKEKFRYSYGRKASLERLSLEKIMLPVDKDGNPDWQFMENYIKSLPYSSSI